MERLFIIRKTKKINTLLSQLIRYLGAKADICWQYEKQTTVMFL